MADVIAQAIYIGIARFLLAVAAEHADASALGQSRGEMEHERGQVAGDTGAQPVVGRLSPPR